MSETFFDTCVFWSCVTRCGCRTTSSTLFTVYGVLGEGEGERYRSVPWDEIFAILSCPRLAVPNSVLGKRRGLYRSVPLGWNICDLTIPVLGRPSPTVFWGKEGETSVLFPGMKHLRSYRPCFRSTVPYSVLGEGGGDERSVPRDEDGQCVCISWRMAQDEGPCRREFRLIYFVFKFKNSHFSNFSHM